MSRTGHAITDRARHAIQQAEHVARVNDLHNRVHAVREELMRLQSELNAAVAADRALNLLPGELRERLTRAWRHVSAANGHAELAVVILDAPEDEGPGAQPFAEIERHVATVA